MEEAEAKNLLAAWQNYLRHLPVSASQKTVDLVTAVGATVFCYSPRVVAYGRRKHARQAPPQRPAGPAQIFAFRPPQQQPAGPAEGSRVAPPGNPFAEPLHATPGVPPELIADAPDPLFDGGYSGEGSRGGDAAE